MGTLPDTHRIRSLDASEKVMSGQLLEMASENMNVFCRHSGPFNYVCGLAVDNQNMKLATRGSYYSIYIWDLCKCSLVHTIAPNLPEYATSFFGMAFHPTLPYFAFMEPEGTICVMHS